MSLWGRFLGNRRNRECAEGVALLEQGRYAEAVALLRDAALDSSEHPTGSLVSFHFRQALVTQGRHHLRNGAYPEAIVSFDEAARLWDQYPDLHCLLGAARGLAGDWEDSLGSARTALRRNPDYAEARLLEALALQKLDRLVEAADSLNSLVESGRRVEHWLIEGLAEQPDFTPTSLPADLESLLVTSLSGQSEKEEVAAAVAQCRAGYWQEGLDRFAALVRKRPRYPDYRTRHSAALFHLGRHEEALAEVEAALALNEGYRTAINLKGLILADEGRLHEARLFLEATDAANAAGKQAGSHEELFGSYLRGVVTLLTGDPARVHEMLEGWGDLVRNFARAELLLAGADDLLDRPVSCGRRLAGLAAEWTAEPIYFHLLTSHHLAGGNYEDAAGVLSRWPAHSRDNDWRPLYLEAGIALGQNRIPDLPEVHDPGAGQNPESADEQPRPEAWQYLAARVALHRGDAGQCWKITRKLMANGFDTEPVAHLQALAAARAVATIPQNWTPEKILPLSCLPPLVYLGIGRGDTASASAELEKYRSVHPEFNGARWLSPAFWLDPVRSWIA